MKSYFLKCVKQLNVNPQQLNTISKLLDVCFESTFNDMPSKPEIEFDFNNCEMYAPTTFDALNELWSIKVKGNIINLWNRKNNYTMDTKMSQFTPMSDGNDFTVREFIECVIPEEIYNSPFRDNLYAKRTYDTHGDYQPVLCLSKGYNQTPVLFMYALNPLTITPAFDMNGNMFDCSKLLPPDWQHKLKPYDGTEINSNILKREEVVHYAMMSLKDNVNKYINTGKFSTRAYPVAGGTWKVTFCETLPYNADYTQGAFSLIENNRDNELYVSIPKLLGINEATFRDIRDMAAFYDDDKILTEQLESPNGDETPILTIEDAFYHMFDIIKQKLMNHQRDYQKENRGKWTHVDGIDF